MPLRAELVPVLQTLLAKSEQSLTLSLDDIGEAIGALPVAPEEIDALIAALEAEGRQVLAKQGGDGQAGLGRVVAATRALVGETGQPPTLSAVAARAGLSEDEVRHALALLRVMQGP